jgi:hypothetical protein
MSRTTETADYIRELTSELSEIAAAHQELSFLRHLLMMTAAEAEELVRNAMPCAEANERLDH